MLHELIGWFWIVLAMLSAAAGLLTLYRRPDGDRRRCGGRASSVRRIIDPRCWFLRGLCWYSLTGLSIDARGFVRCPECGHEARFDRSPRDGPRCRWSAVSLAALVLASSIVTFSWLHGGTWARPLPLTVLAFMDRAPSKAVGKPVRKEVDRRIQQNELTPWATRLLIASLGKDLLDDDRRHNAERAIDLLANLWPQSRVKLEECLELGDAQARILAAEVLRRKCSAPSQALLKATVEDLRDDARDVRWYLSLGNARQACDYLLEHAGAAEVYLVQAMDSQDRQQRLLAAAVLGFAGRTSHIDLAAPILIDHLRDNHVRGDAKIAAPALFRVGRAAMPYLRDHVDSDDEQLRAAARSIIEQTEHPDRPIHKLNNPMPKLSVLTHDPLSLISLSSAANDLLWPRTN